MTEALIDGFGRRIDYVRVSVTDRCNYRCFYCMPGEGAPCSAREELLDVGELERLIRCFVDLGVGKVRLTGGEPLMRRDLEMLIGRIRQLDGLSDISLSTNGHLLAGRAVTLKQSGLDRVNVSLDSLDPSVFASITGHDALEGVLAGIEAANEAGLVPVKVNTVVMRGINDREIGALLDYAMHFGLELRFIETMPVGSAGEKGFTRFLPAEEILARVKAYCGTDLMPVKGGKGAGPARYYQLGAGPARVGVISAISQHFCDGCNRVRLTATGDLILCLDGEGAVPLGSMLRTGASDQAIRETIRAAIARKPERHEFLGVRAAPLRAMSGLGG